MFSKTGVKRMATVRDMANELKTSEEQIMRWVDMYDVNYERIENGLIPFNMESFIRERHLMEIHPEVYKLLCRIYPHNNSYERWLGQISYELRKRGE